MAVNKVVVGGETKIDLSGDTVTPAKLLAGIKAHDSSGARITGSIATYAGSTSVTPGTSAQTLQTAGKYLNADIIVAAAQASGKQVATGSVTPTKSDLYNYDITVTGLGFTPSIVVFYVNEVNGIPMTSKSYVVASISGAWTVLAKGATISFVRGNTSSSSVYLKPTDGGFRLSANSSSYYVGTIKYNYIAIGA